MRTLIVCTLATAHAYTLGVAPATTAARTKRTAAADEYRHHHSQQTTTTRPHQARGRTSFFDPPPRSKPFSARFSAAESLLAIFEAS